MEKNNLQSVICNTVHDSIVMDVHPDEKEICIKLMVKAWWRYLKVEKRYGIQYTMPVDIELKMGYNWLDLNEVYV